MNSKTFSQSVEEFLADADWISSVDAPAVVALQRMAHELDNSGVNAALLGQYGLTYRNLLTRMPEQKSEQKSGLQKILETR